MSIVRNNLLTRLGYVPYCGRDSCFSRVSFDGAQFKCRCGWRSDYEPEFIEQYKAAQAKLKAQLDQHPVHLATGVTSETATTPSSPLGAAGPLGDEDGGKKA